MTADYVHIEETTVSDLWRLAARYRFPRRLNGGHSASSARSGRQSRLGRDFDGYVPYRTGEDVRHVDWPLYARTGGLYVRRYQMKIRDGIYCFWIALGRCRCSEVRNGSGLNTWPLSSALLLCARS